MNSLKLQHLCQVLKRQTSSVIDVQVATELVIGFPTSFLTQELLERQKCLFLAWIAGFVALPINLPGFGKHQISHTTICKVTLQLLQVTRMSPDPS